MLIIYKKKYIYVFKTWECGFLKKNKKVFIKQLEWFFLRDKFLVLIFLSESKYSSWLLKESYIFRILTIGFSRKYNNFIYSLNINIKSIKVLSFFYYYFFR